MAKAILLGGASPLTAAFIRGWLAGGNEIAEIWWGQAGSFARSQRTASQWAPNWSVRSLAARHAIPVLENRPLKQWGTGAIERAQALGADTLITCVTMQIVPRALIDHFPGRAVNFHPARLPRYRGPSPFLGMLLDGVEHENSAMTLHELVPGIDEGPIIAQRTVPADNAARRYQRWQMKFAVALEAMSREELPAFLVGRLTSVAQQGGHYRRVGNEAWLGPHMSYAEAALTISRAGATGRMHALTPSGARAVRAPLQRLGGASGEAARVGPLSIDLDLADARVRVARWTALDRALGKLDMLQAMHEADRRRQE